MKIQRCQNGVIVDGTPYAFRKRGIQQSSLSESSQELLVYQHVVVIQNLPGMCVRDWEQIVPDNFTNNDNIFLLVKDLT